MQLFKV